jgi:lipoyl(octanoyl) transferase
MTEDLLVCQLGRVEYREAYALQERLRERVQAGEHGDVLLLLEHPPVYTLGRRSEPGDLPMGEDWYRSQGIDVVRTDRGGKLTYHGPGQLVGYPIVHVESIPEHVRAMETAIVEALAQEGLPGARGRDHEGPEWTGVWMEERKIASIGVHVSRGVSMHGFAVNVDNDLQPFEWVVACGLPTTRMTSICRETGRAGQLRCFRKRVAYAYAQALGRRQRLVSPARIGALRPVVSTG